MPLKATANGSDKQRFFQLFIAPRRVARFSKEKDGLQLAPVRHDQGKLAATGKNEMNFFRTKH
jgi:hypothetical protein